MSLIKCPECGKVLSEFAEKCPSCGCPIDKIKENLDKNENGILGTTIAFGNFKEIPICWDVRAATTYELLLVSKYIIDAREYDSRKNNYYASTIRYWLNNTFYNEAFNDYEKKNIFERRIDNSAHSTNDWRNPYLCLDTYDNVSLLSLGEAREYFASDDDRKKKPLENLMMGLDSFDYFNGCADWWLRSPGFECDYVSRHVNSNGDIETLFDGDDIRFGNEHVVSNHYGIVPVIRIKRDYINNKQILRFVCKENNEEILFYLPQGTIFVLPPSLFINSKGKSFSCWRFSKIYGRKKPGFQFTVDGDYTIEAIWKEGKSRSYLSHEEFEEIVSNYINEQWQ